MTSSDPHWMTGQTVDHNSAPWKFGMNKDYFLLVSKILCIIFFVMLTINLLALFVSLQCNRNTQTYS